MMAATGCASYDLAILVGGGGGFWCVVEKDRLDILGGGGVWVVGGKGW